MQFRFVLLGLTILNLFTPTFAADEWIGKIRNLKDMSQVNKISLLKSNRSETEKILGNPENFKHERANNIEYYSTKFGRVTITYTTEVCKTRTRTHIPKDVVEEISIELEKNIPLLDLKLPLDKFVIAPEDDIPVDIYSNEKYGIKLTVYNNGDTGIKEITDINFVPPQSWLFACES